MKDTTINSIMSSKVISVDVTADIAHIQELFQRYSYRHIPVTNNNKLAGVINRIDFISKIQGWNSRFVSVESEAFQMAGQFMIEDILKLPASTSIRQAIYDMKEDKRGVICVVNEEEEIIGIVTLFDLINKYIHRSIYNDNSERSRLMRE